MSYDGTMTRAMVHELTERFTGARIDKIYQAESDEIMLQLRNKSNRGNLVISASASNPALYITGEKKQNPMTPPPFCMLLRKHLESGKILSFEQVEMDRIVKIKVEAANELFDRVEKTLVIEIMGRHSNIILLGEDGTTILDSIKKVSPSISSVRQILPGLTYTNEMIVEKDNPLLETRADFENRMEDEKNLPVKKFIMENFMGFSPLITREIIYRAGVEEKMTVADLEEGRERFIDAFFALQEILLSHNYDPALYQDEGDILAFSALPLLQYPIESKVSYPSVSTLLDDTLHQRDNRQRIQQKSQDLHKQMKNHLDKLRSKEKKLRGELAEAKDRDKYKIYGDVLSAHTWEVERGDKSVTLENFYDEMKPITIPLDEKKDAIQNVTAFYKKYAKLKHGNQVIEKQLTKTRKDMAYLDDILYSLEEAETIEDIEEIREEYRGNFLNKKTHSKKKENKPRSFLTYKTPSGAHLYVGRNNRENEVLTLKFAAKDDLWFHVKQGPGSHVLLRTEGEPSEEDIYLAAQLAAINSRQRLSANVEIDYTVRAHVKRHPDNRPGLVIYTDFQTLFVTPEKSIYRDLEEVK